MLASENNSKKDHRKASAWFPEETFNMCCQSQDKNKVLSICSFHCLSVEKKSSQVTRYCHRRRVCILKYNLLPVSFEHGSTTNLNTLVELCSVQKYSLLYSRSALTADSTHRVNSVSIASQKLQTTAT